ncbi:MAG: PAS domain S-box protein [Anaerolineae bacterium]|nr:PAS domain S-box protein [Anaerolineae bacterium]
MFNQAMGYALCAAMMTLFWRQNHRRFAGMGFWAADFTMQGIALLVFTLRDPGPISVEYSIMVGSTLIVGGTILFCVGLERFFKLPSHSARKIALLTVFILIHAYFTFAKSDLTARNINTATAILVVFLRCIWVLGNQKVQPFSITRWITVVFAGYCVISIVRIISSAILAPEGDFLTQNGPVDIFANLGYQILVLALTFLIFLMLNQRLFLENAEQQSALQESENRYRQLVELSPEAVVVYQGGKISFVNSAAVRMLKANTPEDLLGREVLEFVHPDQRALAAKRIAETLATDKAAPLLEEKLICLDGTFVDVEVTTSRLDYHGRPALQTIARDISRRKRIESQLQEYRQQLETQNLELRKLTRALEQSASTIVMTNAQGIIEYVNPAFTHITGYTADEALGQNPRILKSGYHGTELYGDLWATIRSGDTWQGEIINRKKDGSLYYEAATISPVKDRNGNITHFIAVKDDITARKQAEEALRKSEEALRQYAEQLAAQNADLDAFAHTVAHDLKNPIGLIIGYADLLRDEQTPLTDAQRQSALRVLAQTGKKLNTIIEELMLLSGLRKQTVTVAPVNMPDVIEQAKQRLLDQIAQHDAILVLQDENPWPQALGYAPWIEEVWANYLSNALKYGGKPDEGMPPRIEMGWNWEQPQAQGELRDAETQIRFWVRDNGQGLSEEAQARLFVPFTRLDQVRVQGHGLGLSIVQRIIERQGGRVGVESTPGKGSTFYFVLPAAADPFSTCSTVKIRPDQQQGDQTTKAPPTLEGLSQEWLDALRQAAIECDIEAIQTLGGELQAERPDVSGFVEAQAHAFAYEALLNWLDSAA